MSKPAAHGSGAPDKDEDGLAVQKYTSLVLVVVPPRDYAEQTLRHARSSLYNVHVGTWSVSTESTDLIKGRLQDEFLVDADLRDADMAPYSGVVFVGGEGALELASNADAQRIAREAAAAGKMIGAWGHSTAILARAGVLAGKRVTGAPAVRDLAVKAGAKWTGRQLERDGVLVTASDEAVGMRFGKALAQIVGI
jgi:putative intracellular protease/amidase